MAIDYSKMKKTVTSKDGKVISEEAAVADDGSPQPRLYWWLCDDDAVAKQIQSTILFIKDHQSTRMEQLVADTRLYGSADSFGFIGPALMRSASASASSISQRISFNLCASVVDTLVSKVAKNKVIPTFITSGGVWGMQRKAEQLSKLIEGLFYDQDVHKKGVDTFRDGAVWGTGIVHVYEGPDDRPVVERAFPHEFFVDAVESLCGDPRQLHRVKIADRGVVMAMAEEIEDKKERAAAIEAVKNAKTDSFVDLGSTGTVGDLVAVIESWHLRSSEKSDDGKHVICVGDAKVISEPYEKDYFPFPMFHYNKKLMGFWGTSACTRLMNLQQEVNRLMILIQRSMWMGGSFKVLLHTTSKVVSQHVNNDVGALIRWAGNVEPKYITPPMIQQDIYPYVDALIAKGYQQEGVSQLSAASLKPQGVDSGAALRTFDNIADDRMLFTGQEMESFFLEVARQLIEVGKDIYSRKKSFKVQFPQTSFLETIDWKDVKLKDDEYVLKAFPTSSLPDEPAGKLQTVQEYMQAGLLSPRAGRRLLAMPDVEMSDRLFNAAENLLHKTFEDILYDEDKKVKGPEPEWDLTLAGQLYVEYYNYAALNDAPEKVMKRLRQWKRQLDDLTGQIAQAVQQQAAAQQPAQGQTSAPPANPTPTPTSQLIPNTAQA